MEILLLPALVAIQSARMPRNVKPRAAAPVTTSIALTIKTSSTTLRTGALPAQPQASPRPAVTLKSGEKPQIRWEVRNRDLKKPVGSIVVHFLVTRENGAGAAIPLAPQKGSYQDSVLGTDLSPREGTTGEYNTAIYEPGTYLIELEILDEVGARRQFCAVDVTVE